MRVSISLPPVRCKSCDDSGTDVAHDRRDTKSPAQVPRASCTGSPRTGARRANWPRQLLKPSLSCVTVAGSAAYHAQSVSRKPRKEVLP